MAALFQIYWIGKSGNKYLFNVYPITEECPSESGIYVFSKATPIPGGGENHTPIYIGKAQSFQARFYNHHKDDCIDKHGANRICLKHVPNEKERDEMEKDLLAAYATKCNEVNNPITPR